MSNRLGLQAWTRSLAGFEGVLPLVGTCKNAGKTTLLNFLISQLPLEGTAVTSLGRDGERLDVLEGHAKPAIHLPPRCLFATAEQALSRSQGEWTILQLTSISTPLGPVVIARTAGPSRLELAGPSTVSGLAAVAREMQRLGALRLLLDGAFDRVAGASARLASGLLIAAGSAGRNNAQETVREAFNYVRRYQLPVYDPAGAAGPVQERSSLTGAEVAGLTGAVVLPDPSSCLLDSIAWSRVERGDIRLFVRRQIPLLGIFVSSFRPGRPSLDPERLYRMVRERCQPFPVFDLLLEGVLHDARAHAGSNVDR